MPRPPPMRGRLCATRHIFFQHQTLRHQLARRRNDATHVVGRKCDCRLQIEFSVHRLGQADGYFIRSALGFAIAWPMDSTSAFHAIINLFLIPLWLLSGALFPLSSASGWLKVVMYINPLTYGVEALRTLLYPNGTHEFSLASSMATLILFSLFMFGLAFVVANRRTTKPAA